MTKNKKVKKANQLSDFWIVDKFDVSKYDSLVVDKSVHGYMKLAAMRRSISDFVRIITHQRIPVEFLTKEVAPGFTDGKKVYISAKIEAGDLDSTVGLSLHEASHILLTDFRLLLHLANSIPDKIYKQGEKKGATKKIVEYLAKNLLNWVEDRRIDHYLYNEFPGYKGYYRALYDRYFNSEVTTKSLQSNEFRTEDVDSYMHRIINMTNPATDFDALKGLREISEIISLKTIDRLKDTAQALTVALEVLEVIFKYVDKIDTQKMEQQADGEGDNTPSDGIEYDEESTGKGKSSKGSNKGKENLTKEELEQLAKEIEKQRDFLNGKIHKVKLSGNDLEKLNQIADSGTEIKKIKIAPPKNERRDYDSVYNVKEYNVTVIKRVTLEMADSGILEFIGAGNSYYGSSKLNETAVRDGIRIGKQLGRKLQIRNEEKLTKYTRKETGKMDRRLVADLGFGNASIFQQTFVELYADAILHMSIDVSGSMGGNKLSNAIKVVTAICQAASMTNGNLNVIVDVRSTQGLGEPFVAIIYDSRVDNMIKVKKLFPRIETAGGTPEGLCFAAIQDLIESSTNKLNSYFLNLSDGEPYYTGYSGMLAAEHTRGEVHKMRQRGIKVLSYFISDDDYHHSQFELMYGKSAAYINPDSLMDIARTLNKMFLSKGE